MKLDIGCGDYKKRGYLGVDLDRHKETDVICDALYLPFRDNVFDAINANQVLEHLYAPLLSLREWRRVLKSTGTIALCVPNLTYYRRFIRYVLNKPVSQNRTHIQGFTISELMNLTRIAGFSIASYQFLTEYFRKESISRFRSVFKHLTNRQLRLTLIVQQ